MHTVSSRQAEKKQKTILKEENTTQADEPRSKKQQQQMLSWQKQRAKQTNTHTHTGVCDALHMCVFVCDFEAIVHTAQCIWTQKDQIWTKMFGSEHFEFVRFSKYFQSIPSYAKKNCKNLRLSTQGEKQMDCMKYH